MGYQAVGTDQQATWSYSYTLSLPREPATIPRDKTVKIAEFKRWASENLGSAPRLRYLILSEKDELTYAEFLVKEEIWAKLLDEETRHTKGTHM